MSIFNIIKENVSAKDIVEHYGLTKAGKLYSCPFHNDSNPSMLAENRFFCFGCGAKGDAIDLAAEILNLKPKEAAEQIAADFGIFISDEPTEYHARDKPDKRISLRDERLKTIEELIEYEKTLKMLLPVFAPKPDDETMSQAFIITQEAFDFHDTPSKSKLADIGEIIDGAIVEGELPDWDKLEGTHRMGEYGSQRGWKRKNHQEYEQPTMFDGPFGPGKLTEDVTSDM